MVRSLLLPVGTALLGAWTAAADQATCSLENKCPESAPCCSQYGQCGVGAYCLGGCDPRMSFSLDACTPEPVCESKTYAMTSTAGLVGIDKYLGDPSTADFVCQGEPAAYNGNVLLTMPANSVGTVCASTAYLWYGNVKATLKTSRGAGVVTAFILLSDVKDEIDYEFVGTELTTAQTNYYFQGIPDYDNSANISVTDTYANFHTYEIQWTPDTITWLVDGVAGRTKKRSDTWNATANQWNYPQTPARVQLSIWPGGASTNAPGTISWAGGPIDWNSTDIKNYGYDFATIGTVEVQCYNATGSGPGTNTGVSYTYSNANALNSSVQDGTKNTTLASFLATGLDMEAGASNASGSSAGAQASASAATIPGGDASGPGANGDQGGSSGSGSGSGSGSASGTSSSSGCATTGFAQSCSDGSKSEAGRQRALGAERVLGGPGASAFAVVVGVAALVWL